MNTQINSLQPLPSIGANAAETTCATSSSALAMKPKRGRRLSRLEKLVTLFAVALTTVDSAATNPPISLHNAWTKLPLTIGTLRQVAVDKNGNLFALVAGN